MRRCHIKNHISTTILTRQRYTFINEIDFAIKKYH